MPVVSIASVGTVSHLFEPPGISTYSRHRAASAALGDDRREVLVLGGLLEQHLAAHGEADAADAAGIDVGPAP